VLGVFAPFAASAAFALRSWHGGHGVPCPYRGRAVRPHPLRPLRYGLGMGARRAVPLPVARLCDHTLCGLCVTVLAWGARRAVPLPVARCASTSSHPLRPLRYGLGMGGTACRAPTGGAPVRPHPLRPLPPLRPLRYGLGMGGTACRAPTGGALCVHTLCGLCSLCGLCVSSFAPSAAFA
jgi:hypothetical protein